MAYRYRNRETGRFTSEWSWSRSHGRSGDYVREHIEEKEDEEPDEERPTTIEEWEALMDEADDQDYDFEDYEVETGPDYGHRED